MGSLQNGKTWLIKHQSDALWLALAGVFVAITVVLAYEVAHIEPMAASSSAQVQQRFRVYHLPADPKCESCKLTQVEVEYALKPNSLAAVTFSFRQRQETMDDVVFISLNNLKGRSCKFFNHPNPPQIDVQGDKADQISFPIKKDMKADENERVVSVGCDLTVTVHAYSFTKFELPFYYATAVVSGETVTPDTGTDPSVRAPTQSISSLENGANTEPAKSSEPPPAKPALPEPPKKPEDFSKLMLRAEMREVHAENIRFDAEPSKSVQLSPGGKVVTMSWSSEELEGKKEWWLVFIGICSAGAVAALIEVLRPHIDRPKKKRNPETV